MRWHIIPLSNLKSKHTQMQRYTNRNANSDTLPGSPVLSKFPDIFNKYFILVIVSVNPELGIIGARHENSPQMGRQSITGTMRTHSHSYTQLGAMLE